MLGCNNDRGYNSNAFQLTAVMRRTTRQTGDFGTGQMADNKQNQTGDDYERQFMPPDRRDGVSDPPGGAPDEAPPPAEQPDAPTIADIGHPTAAVVPAAEPAPATPEVAAPPPVSSPPTAAIGVASESRTEAAAPFTSASDGFQPEDEEKPLPYVEANDLFKIYKPADLEVVALRGVDLEVAPGELIGIVGASGSGKTTMLNILAGLERPSAGRIRVGDRDLLDISDRELVAYRRREVGFVWQATGRNLVPYLNVRDNIELPQAITGAGKQQRRERAAELLDALQMSDKGRRYPSELSGGEQQRVAIAVALANNPPLLLADEPTGELDTNMAEDVFRMLQRINQRFGVTVIIVTHYAGIARWVDRVVRIRDGRIGSESYLTSSYRGDIGEEQEYLVIDRAGRLQLPREFIDQLSMDGLASAGITDDGDSITLRPAVAPHRSRTRSQITGGESDDAG